ncbi:biotin synthase [Halopolyspora algeriensis]|uniref:Biotin synthase n=1 Tax=Halopolyspora algeriensis TaxID=1500506 RepID=A0A368VNU4_9ACTN|nr:biotin synthase BioB [Halopolyspora algeriensis]RCW43190.1 biotin synthase [Halopolyspora algeriensis]TQM56249.1 biotin synthase [Halopolyspora algeriensis]
MTNLLDELVTKALDGRAPTRDEALALLVEETDSPDVLDVVAAGSRVRRHFFGRRVKLNTIINMKSGLCPEDCGYCSQRLGSGSDILKYSWIEPDEAAKTADRAAEAGAKRICLVASGRGPGRRDIGRITDTIAAIKDKRPGVEICACLGLLSEGQGEQLAEAGAYAYNHNLNTNEARYADICSTHTFGDRVDTVRQATGAGLSPCSGALFGMGESDEDIVSLAFELRELDPDSVPINFLIPFEGTPLSEQWDLTPQRCLRILALFRFCFPDVEVRLAGGREIHLRGMQPMALHLANSIFLGDYLTSEGQEVEQDRRMITDAGFTIEGAEERTLPDARRDLVTIRRRGAGTELPANA